VVTTGAGGFTTYALDMTVAPVPAEVSTLTRVGFWANEDGARARATPAIAAARRFMGVSSEVFDGSAPK